MNFRPSLLWPTAADRAVALAEEVLARAGDPVPAVAALPPRSRGAYDRLVDAVNRLPRPLMVLGSLVLLLSALIAPDWFAARMEALAELPEALWWIIGAVLSLHFGSRFQHLSLEARRDAAAPPPPAPAIDPAPASPGSDAAAALATLVPGPNAALADWGALPRP